MTDTVAKRSGESQAMLNSAMRLRALMGGTAAMRAAGKAYLPKNENESDASYKSRLETSWLFNAYRKTVRDMAGKVFRKPVELTDPSDNFALWAENIDLQGNDLSRFLLKVFIDAISGPGVSYIMVEAPRREAGRTYTNGDAVALGLRPYLVSLRVEDVLGWKTGIIGGATVLTQIRIAETVTEQDASDEFSHEEVQQIRVMDRPDNGNVRVRIYRQDKKGGWAQYADEEQTDQTEITIAPFYANREAFFAGSPPLDDLADLNIAHWQSQSDQNNILHVARVPILHVTGRDQDEGVITIGAKTAIVSRDPTAKVEFAEHEGRAIGAGRTHLMDLKDEMGAFGLQLIAAQMVSQSATGAAADVDRNNTPLAMLADSLKDTTERALGWMAEMGGEPVAPLAAVNDDFGVSVLTPQEVQVMLSAVTVGELPRSLFLSELKRRGFIAADTDLEAVIEQLEDQGETGIDG